MSRSYNIAPITLLSEPLRINHMFRMLFWQHLKCLLLHHFLMASDPSVVHLYCHNCDSITILLIVVVTRRLEALPRCLVLVPSSSE